MCLDGPLWGIRARYESLLPASVALALPPDFLFRVAVGLWQPPAVCCFRFGARQSHVPGEKGAPGGPLSALSRAFVPSSAAATRQRAGYPLTV